MMLGQSVPPMMLLGVLVAISGAGWIGHRVVRHGHGRRLRRLAGEWKMHYAARDMFQLSGKVGGDFPLPGGYEVRVVDLIYAWEGNRHRYLFTVEYAEGPGVDEPRQLRAMSLCEPGEGEAMSVAPAGLSLVEQYRHLHERCA